ncbi:hypothetical protein LRS13_03625 [Svornostia abyssi]|uniref:Uncharacterized protein n=1 Tax=Svornostia abyssi TaxID=2898438 RepID=A0ABY5PJ15_9ACTN|nr:hypothetical protein LRS13_03625 [Parviterribacteraceae bacterium J379]
MNRTHAVRVAAGAVPVAAAAVAGVRPPGFRRPGAIETRAARRRRERAERRTQVLGVLAGCLTAAVVGGEVARVWRRGSAPLPAETQDLVGAAEEAVRETVAVAREGYRVASAEERALVNLLLSFTATFGVARLTTHGIRTRGRVGPFRNLVVGDSHVHHFVPGILLAFLSGGAGLIARDESLDPFLAVPFGAGGGADVRRIRAPAQARRRLLDRGGHRQRADRPHDGGDDVGRRTRPAGAEARRTSGARCIVGAVEEQPPAPTTSPSP